MLIPGLFDSLFVHGELGKWLLVMTCFPCSLFAEQCESPMWTVIGRALSGHFSLRSILEVDVGLSETD